MRKCKAKLHRLIAKYGMEHEIVQRAFDREILRKFHKTKQMAVQKPLIQEERYRVEDPEDYDSCLIEYGFTYVDEMSDTETDKTLWDRMARIINSPHDCTGKLFTSSINWKRNPCGLISFQHRLYRDV